MRATTNLSGPGAVPSAHSILAERTDKGAATIGHGGQLFEGTTQQGYPGALESLPAEGFGAQRHSSLILMAVPQWAAFRRGRDTEDFVHSHPGNEW